MNKFPNVFSTGRIGTLQTKNRLIMAPMATNFADPGGGVTDTMIRYYVERAKGGAGLIIVENANVDFPLGANGAVQLRIDEDRFLPGLARLREAICDADPSCRAAIQINHAGGQTVSAKTGGLQVVAPSDVPTRTGGEVPRPLTCEEIAGLVEKYAMAADRARRAGFDAVEIHGGFGYLLAQFLSPLCNKRRDQYGGSVENRVRFPIEIIKRTRQIVGPGFPILFRLNGDEFTPGGVTPEESAQYAGILEKASVDLIHVSAGCGFKAARHIEPMAYPQGVKAEIAAAVKEKISIPVAAVGVIREPEIAEKILADGQADFIAIGRTLIADPHWPDKALRGELYNHCISCNECARRRVSAGLPIRCSVNPLVGNEAAGEERRRTKPDPKKILIVGGGPAGLRASIEAARDGHHVTLLEKEKTLGGRGIIAARPPHKEKIRWLLDDLTKQAEQQGVTIRPGVAATKEMIRRIHPDVLIIAMGSESVIPSWLGNTGDFCVTAEAILESRVLPENRLIAVIGAGSVGCETAEYLAGFGNKVTILEMLDQAAVDLEPITRADLLERLKKLDIGILTNCRVCDIGQGAVTYEKDGKRETLEADKAVYAGGSRRAYDLMEELEELQNTMDVYIAGDSRKPERFVDAARDAYMAVRAIREKG